MIRSILMASVALLSAWPALAQMEPPACPGGDPRNRCVAPGPNQVVMLRARPGAALVIDLPPGETVLAVPVSDNRLLRDRRGGGMSVRLADEEEDGTADGSLAVAVRGSSVVLKPYQPLNPQPFFILTERAGQQQRYSFELRADAEAGASFFYSVRVRNMAAEEGERRERAEAQARERDEQRARGRLAHAAADPCQPGAAVNFRYVGRGDGALAPSQVCDDGQSTFLRFPGNQRLPAIFSVLPDGREAAVNFSTAERGMVIVHEASPMLRLRDGGRVLCLINRGYDPRGRNPGTGTISPDVVRQPRAPAS